MKLNVPEKGDDQVKPLYRYLPTGFRNRLRPIDRAVKVTRQAFTNPLDNRNPITRSLAEKGIFLDPSLQEWYRLHNLYEGRPGFVIGNGPSLTIEDLDRLVDQVTIASNKMYLAYVKTDFRPTLLTVVDKLAAENNADEFRRLPAKKYLSNALRTIVEPCPGAVYWNEESGFVSKDTMLRKFSPDIRECNYTGHTVTYNNLQIAFHLGLETVYLIGMDFTFTIPEKKIKRNDDIYKEALVCEGEVNHFLPNYRKPGETWSPPNLEYQKWAFISAKQFFEAHGRKIYNATRGGKLEVFPRVDLDEVLNELTRRQEGLK